MSRVVESDQRLLHEKVFPQLLDAFGITDYEFEKVLKLDPEDGPAQTYVKRCGMFLEKPPEKDWDGVFTHTDKG